MAAKEEFIKGLKYILRCEECGGNKFNALPTGHISCEDCGLTYMYINMIQEWVFTAIDPEEFILKKFKKIWDADSESFKPIKQMLIKKYEDERKRLEEKRKNKKKDKEK